MSEPTKIPSGQGPTAPREESSPGPAPDPDHPSFMERMARAARRANSANQFVPTRNHIIFRTAQKSIIQPLGELIAMVRGLARNAKSISLQESEELFLDVAWEQVSVWIRNAQMAFVMQSIFCLLGSLIVVWGAHRAGYPGISTSIGGMLIVIFAASNGLRAARDVEIFRTRQPLTFKAFFARFEELWFPLPQAHPWHKPVKYVVIPATLLVILFAPISRWVF